MSSDEELMKLVVAGQAASVQELHGRYAPLVYHLGAQSLGHAAAEDLVQEVFLQVWRRASTFDPHRGTVKPWLLQITHFRILNELRRRSRRPERKPEDTWDEWPDTSPEPQEETWKEFRKSAVRAAVDRLPSAQRQALSLAFFEELTHDQVANTLRLPLGTVKTRIRTALLSLRSMLAPLVMVLVLAGFGTAAWLQSLRTSRALSLVSSSHAEEDRLAAAPGIDPATHGWYKNRQGTSTVVLLLHQFPQAAPGTVYQGWARFEGVWKSVGTAVPDAEGNAVIVAEGTEFAVEPQSVVVTREPWPGRSEPLGQVIVQSSASR